MVYVFTELLGMIDLFCKANNSYDSKHVISNNNTFKTISMILKNNYQTRYGIPYIVLFENDDYIDSLVCDLNLIYDDESGCFVFSNINALINGIYGILKKLHLEHPNDTDLEEKFEMVRTFIQKVYKDYKKLKQESDLSDMFRNVEI